MALKNCTLIFTVLCLSLASTFSAQALDWRIAFGAHDIIVEQADSHTVGVGATFALAHLTQSNILLIGSVDVFVDHDKDKLDPDHIPIWFSSNFMVKRELFRLSPDSAFQWEVEASSRRNTVSSVEKQLKLFPGIGYEYDTKNFFAAVKVGAGYYSLEIDDDVPRMRGYDRGDFQNQTGAYTLAADTRFSLGSSFELSAKIQHWNDGSEWLENRYSVALNYDANTWVEDSVFVVSVEHTEYNLDPYAKVAVDDADYLPILPWDKDTLVRVYIDMPWDF
ncbi:hypothetical protein [Shewanella benthica]|uniref:DUF481 domain-containing protein n=1 Tax=Shewanella benthica KT99 TaxID=314608 RepID=A9D0K9_9GAMM|nr:hypothetical protein [Shewanella benthica]EDQ02132.1 hypothetical protein KT99_20069 [Shewanella benthica KT99]